MSGMKKKLVFKFSKGFRGRAKNCHRVARNRVEKAMQHAYKGRKLKKRDNKKIWIGQINAGSMQYGLAYNQFMHGLGKENIQLNRKMLAELAENEPYSFESLVALIKPSITRLSIQKSNFEEVGYKGMQLGNMPPEITEEQKATIFQSNL
ncbi:hypothetical protein AAMO2058_000493300 [Amorphochlora amoebiformis]